MYHYNFTNDLRISTLEESLYEAAKLIQTDSIPSSYQDKSKNNNINTLKFYFNIQKDNEVMKAILDNRTRQTIINFIKKFQFPNVRKEEDFKNQVKDDIIIAPLRLCFKMLYISFLSDGEQGYISKKEIVNFLFFDNDVSKKKNPNLISAYKKIKDSRDTKAPMQFTTEEINNMWKQCERQLRELLRVLVWSECVVEEQGEYRLDIIKLQLKENRDMLDILIYNDYWEYPNTDDFNVIKESYISYMDLENNFGTLIKWDDNPIFGGQNKIYYGAPGTGKSFIVDKKTKNYDYKRRVTFHPEYTYFDFVGGLKPIQEDNEIRYEFVPGPFTEAIAYALNNPNSKCGLIVEEINRANTAAVFGDLFQLLDRNNDGYSEYVIKNKEVVNYILSILEDKARYYYEQKLVEINGGISFNNEQQLFLPGNIWLYATMNSSDQGVFMMDSAFKRRWEFEYIPINFNASINRDITIEGFGVTWGEFAVELNNVLSKINGITEDKLIGPYFLKQNDLLSKEKIASKLLIYLWDDVVRYQRDSLFIEKNRFSIVIKDFNDGKQIFIDELHEKLV
ncbi:AAA family ATPase [Carnobacterium divergens]|uniref:AAA family ATPase n=1 Tax=Carnobacterium divergens TaxID=2748 RepID=UPI0039C8DA56